MFIIQQKREEIRVVEEDNRRQEEKKKKEEEDRIGDVNMVATCCTGVCSNHAFLLFFILVFVPAKFLFFGRKVWYTSIQYNIDFLGTWSVGHGFSLAYKV